MKNGKPRKILTFSYDDAVTQDIRLIALLDKYGMKGTFNLNYGLLGSRNELIREGYRVNHNKISIEDVKHVYEGHEIAGHTLTHPHLPMLSEAEIVREVEEDRLRLSELAGYEVVGFAYPYGISRENMAIADLIMENTGVRYCRTTVSSHSFDRQEHLAFFEPSVYHHGEWDRMLELGERFLSLEPDRDQIFYIWGHAYEFDINDSWDKFEDFLRMMSHRDDIEYLTNKDAILTT